MGLEGTPVASSSMPGASSPAEEAKLNRVVAAQLTKTKICGMFQRGACVDRQCRFAHSQTELRAPPDLSKTAICRAFQQGRCFNKDCKFAHGEEELRCNPTVYKTQICNFFERGHCKKGDKCRHAHGSTELRAFQAMAQAGQNSSFAEAPQSAPKQPAQAPSKKPNQKRHEGKKAARPSSAAAAPAVLPCQVDSAANVVQPAFSNYPNTDYFVEGTSSAGPSPNHEGFFFDSHDSYRPMAMPPPTELARKDRSVAKHHQLPVNASSGTKQGNLAGGMGAMLRSQATKVSADSAMFGLNGCNQLHQEPMKVELSPSALFGSSFPISPSSLPMAGDYPGVVSDYGMEAGTTLQCRPLDLDVVQSMPFEPGASLFTVGKSATMRAFQSGLVFEVSPESSASPLPHHVPAWSRNPTHLSEVSHLGSDSTRAGSWSGSRANSADGSQKSSPRSPYSIDQKFNQYARIRPHVAF